MTPEERSKTTVYTSGEHCPMCAAAHGWVGLGRIIYASSSEQLVQWVSEMGETLKQWGREKNRMKKVAEICCGSIEDALIAQRAGADRIELNNAMYLFGLTPSLGTIKLAVESCHVPLVVMARPRPGGFNYNDHELDTILADIESMVEYDIEGVAFGCLDENRNIDKEKNKKIIDVIHKGNKDAIFHRAFDGVKNPFRSMELLIDLGVKRVLTSGLNTTAERGVELLAELQHSYGDKIEILAGGGGYCFEL